MKQVDIPFNYFKQGDDFAHHIKNNPPLEALKSYKEQMESVVLQIDTIIDILESNKSSKVKMGGDTHCVWISAPDSIIRELKKEDLVMEYEEV